MQLNLKHGGITRESTIPADSPFAFQGSSSLQITHILRGAFLHGISYGPIVSALTCLKGIWTTNPYLEAGVEWLYEDSQSGADARARLNSMLY